MKKEKIKIVFLDIDGVLNCATTTTRFGGCIGIDPFMVAIFNRIIFATDAKIVLSSSWRGHGPSEDEIRQRVMPFIDITPRDHKGFRGSEIKAWLEQNKDKYDVERYAILDDDGDFFKDQPLFKTTWKVGLTQEIADKVVEYLNK